MNWTLEMLQRHLLEYIESYSDLRGDVRYKHVVFTTASGGRLFWKPKGIDPTISTERFDTKDMSGDEADTLMNRLSEPYVFSSPEPLERIAASLESIADSLILMRPLS